MWFGFVTLGMTLTIRDEDYKRCNDLARPAYAALGHTNDLYSWENEKFEANTVGQACVFNGIWLIMKERSVSEDEAKFLCRVEIRRWISDFQRNVCEAKSDPSLPKYVKVYFEALLYSYIGNLAWSIECPRYKDLGPQRSPRLRAQLDFLSEVGPDDVEMGLRNTQPSSPALHRTGYIRCCTAPHRLNCMVRYSHGDTQGACIHFFPLRLQTPL
jgi:hypothetical protein